MIPHSHLGKLAPGYSVSIQVKGIILENIFFLVTCVLTLFCIVSFQSS